MILRQWLLVIALVIALFFIPFLVKAEGDMGPEVPGHPGMYCGTVTDIKWLEHDCYNTAYYNPYCLCLNDRAGLWPFVAIPAEVPMHGLRFAVACDTSALTEGQHERSADELPQLLGTLSPTLSERERERPHPHWGPTRNDDSPSSGASMASGARANANSGDSSSGDSGNSGGVAGSDAGTSDSGSGDTAGGAGPGAGSNDGGAGTGADGGGGGGDSSAGGAPGNGSEGTNGGGGSGADKGRKESRRGHGKRGKGHHGKQKGKRRGKGRHRGRNRDGSYKHKRS